VQNFRLLEDGVSFRLLENGVDFRLLESGAILSQGVIWAMGSWRIKLGQDGDR
jgi:hypothetical protein